VVAERELRAPVAMYLRRHANLRTEFVPLPTRVGGAYIVSNNVAIERRTQNELIRAADEPAGSTSLKLTAQLTSMVALYSRG
jgi:ERCC4-type nuclease